MTTSHHAATSDSSVLTSRSKARPTPFRRSSTPHPAFAGAFLYESLIVHTRTSPLRNVFRYGSYLWLVDVDHLPRPGRLLRPLVDFRTSDHFAGGPASIRENVDSFLAGRGIDLRGGQVLMLTAARVFGYVFNPLSVYWCHDPDGRLVCVLAEVHNTYRGRHTYLIEPDADGRAEIDKDFYVSPFEPASGAHYQMSVPEPGADLALTITLHRPGAAPFVAGVRGRRRPASTRELLRLAARHPLAPLVAATRIRWQGIRLVLRGLPIVPRPNQKKQEVAR